MGNAGRLFLVGALVASGAGVVSVAVPGAAGASSSAAPTIAALQPAAGSTLGYTPVIITGAHLGTATGVTFGHSVARSVRVIDSSHVEAFAPPHGKAKVKVRVRSAHGTSAPRGFTYTYVSPSTWTSAKSPLTAGAPSHRDVQLSDISCPSTSYCLSIGELQQDDPSPNASEPAAGTVGPVIETRSGGSTSTRFAPLPTGLSEAERESAELDAVDCTSSTFCAAVGSYRDGNVLHALLLTMSGGVWFATTGAPPPQLSDSGGVFGTVRLTCGADGSCVAGTSERDASHAGVYDAVVYTLKDGTWTTSVPPVPAGAATPTAVQDLSCASASYCVVAEQSSPRTYLAIYDGSTWTPLAIAPPAGTTSSGYRPLVIGLDCPATGRCTLATVGKYLPGGVTSIVTLSGTTFGYHPIPTQADHADVVASPYGATSAGGSSAISCPSVSVCFVSDTYAEALSSSKRVTRSIVARLDGSTLTVWRMPEPTTPGSSRTVLSGLDCPTTSFCAGVGHRGGDSAASAVHVVFSNGVWQAGTLKQTYTSAKDATYVLSNVACAAAGSCVSNAEVRWDYTLRDEVYGPLRFLGVTATAS